MKTRTEPVEVAVLGAAAMDMFARVETLPRVDSIALAGSLESFPGGSGANVAAGLARLGRRAGFIGKLGGDENGVRLLQAFEVEGVDTQAIILEPGLPSTVCFITVDTHGDRTIVAFKGVAVIEGVEELNTAYLSRLRALCISDAFVEVAVAAASTARAGGATIFFNPGGVMMSHGLDHIRPILSQTDVLVISRAEAWSLGQLEDPAARARVLAQAGPRVVVETQGSDGVLVLTHDRTTHVPAFRAAQVTDTTGAGDAFGAGLIAGFLEGAGWESAARLGSAVAALAIGQGGARNGLPTREQVAAFLEREV